MGSCTNLYRPTLYEYTYRATTADYEATVRMHHRKMNILVAPGSYKGTLRSIDAVKVIADSLEAMLPYASINRLVLADGGEGTLEAFCANFGYSVELFSARNPIGIVSPARIGFLDNDALIESAEVVGISLVNPRDQNPFVTSSYGVGELINHAVRRGAQQVLVTMGDSCTMDMGIGMLSALGVRFFAASGEIAVPSLMNLNQIIEFDDAAIQSLRQRVSFIGLADTDDYLCGDIGQVRMFGKQKGLPDDRVSMVESAYIKFAEIIARRFGVDVLRVVRASGSGGLGAALHAFLDAPLVNSLDYISCLKPLDNMFRQADMVITGEGCLDNQTRLGKVPYYVARRAGKCCIGIVGRYTKEGIEDIRGICEQVSIVCMNPEIALSDPRLALREAVSSIYSLL